MNNLPQEMVDHVCSYLDHDSLKSTLLVSQKFQLAAELYSGAFRSFTLTKDNIDIFIATYSSRRFRYLQELEYQVIIPASERTGDPGDWDDEDEKQYRESQTELEIVDEHYTQQINLLFSTMKSVEMHPCNETVAGDVHLTIFTPTTYFNLNVWSLQREFIRWLVHLLTPETLPAVDPVRRLTVECPHQTCYSNGPMPSLRKLDLRVPLDIPSELPNLSTLRSTMFSSEPLRYITQD